MNEPESFPAMRPERSRVARQQLVDVSRRRLAWGTPQKLVLVSGAVLLVGTATAFAVIQDAKPVIDRSNAICRAGDQLDSLELGFSYGSTSPDVPGVIEDARKACAAFFAAGVIRLNSDELVLVDGELVGDFPVPDLLECVNDDGIAVIVPSTDPLVCSRLGLAPATEADS